MTAFVAIYDACVLFPNTQRDLLVRVAQAGLVQAKWTQRILTEMSEALRAKRPDITAEQTEILERLLIRAVRDCVVSGFEPLEAALTLPDEGDRHVLAAAITSGAQTIVTNNLKDFPSDPPRGRGSRLPGSSRVAEL